MSQKNREDICTMIRTESHSILLNFTNLKLPLYCLSALKGCRRSQSLVISGVNQHRADCGVQIYAFDSSFRDVCENI
jgi:hypothetical protein